MPKAVVCDLDNTLVARHQEISNYTKETISYLNNKGILFGIASGRPYCQVKPLIEQWQISVDFIIGSNGCELIDLNKHTYDTYYMLKPEWVKEILEFMKPFKANAMMVIDGIQTVQYIDDEVLESSKYMRAKPKAVKDDSEFYIENSKIMFRLEPSHMKECEAYVNAHPNKNYKGFKTQPYLMEFTNINVSKAYALNKYIQRYNVDRNDVWAFGDTSNDNDMLELAGKGICMKNGSDDAKKVADEITDKTCLEDGFADYIYKKLVGNDNER